MVNLWVNKESCKLKYLFYFDETTLRGISPVDLESLLFGAYAEPSLNREEVLEDIKDNSEYVTVIVDDINSVQRNSILKRIFDKDLLPEAKVVVTCRLDCEEFLPIQTPCRVCVEGFSEESIQTYMSHMLREKPDALSYILGNPELRSLCHVPVNAFMVAACLLFPRTATPSLFNTTEVYINIFYQIMKKCDPNLTLRQLKKFIQRNMEKIQDLCKDAFLAINQRSILMQGCEDTDIEHNFLHLLTMRDGPFPVKTYRAFLHNTLQEFFAAIWLLSNPEDIDGFLHQCNTDEGKHMRHVIPFLCGLLSERNLSLVNFLCPEERIEVASTGFIEKVLSLYMNADQDFEDSNEELLFLCQCLFELQSPQACSVFLSRVNYSLDLADGDLHPHQCCALSYVIKQATSMKVTLDLENCRISEQGFKFILDCCEYVRIDSSLLREIWTITLSCENPGFVPDLLKLSGAEMHLLAWDPSVFERAGEVLRQHPQQMSLVLHCHQLEQSLSKDLCRVLLSVLPHITSLRFTEEDMNKYSKEVFRFLLDLSLAAAVSDSAAGEGFSELLCSVCTFPFERTDDDYGDKYQCFLLDLCSRVKDIEIKTSKSLLPAFKPFYQSGPEQWRIDLRRRKSSIFLEVLKLQKEKKPVEVHNFPVEENEVRSFFQCLPYISQLRFQEDFRCTYLKGMLQFLLKLSVVAAEYDAAAGEGFSELLCSVCTFPFERTDEDYGYDYLYFLLDLCSSVKDIEIKTSKSLLPAFKPFYQSGPEHWLINPRRRKSSILLEVLKLQKEKKSVDVLDFPDEESEVRSFLQCLPYISQLRFQEDFRYTYVKGMLQFLLKLSVAAAEFDAAAGEGFSELLCSVCTFPFERTDEYYGDEYQDFLLDLCSRVKDIEIKTGKSLLPAFKPFYQSGPEDWLINLRRSKSSIFLEVLKLQKEKKPVEVFDFPDEESEVRSFLQCLPYISQLSFQNISKVAFNFLVNLSVAAECDAATGESYSELLSSVCSYSTFPFVELNDIYQNEFLLDLYSHIKSYDTKTHRSVYSLLQSVYQSAPAVWSIDLSKRKASLLLEVLKLQTQKKPVELRGWSDEESEVRSFLQCLPYISQLKLHRVCNGKLFLLDCAAVGSHLVELLDNVELKQDLFSRECRTLGRVLRVASKLDLSLTPKHISLRGVRLLFRGVTHLHKLRLNVTMVMRLARAMRTGRGLAPVSVEELSLDVNSKKVSQRALSRVLSCLALLLRLWTVQCLDLTSCRVEGHSLIILLCQQDPLKLRLSKENMQQLFMLLSDAQEVEIMESFLNKVGGDLTSCTLTQEVLVCLLQHHSGPVTVDFRKIKITEKNVRDLLHLLDRIQFKRLTPGFIMCIIRGIYQSRSPQYVSSLLRSTENHIILTTRGLDAADCAALRFTLQHSQGVRLNLMWTSVPEGELESLLQLLSNVSQLSVDRQLLLRFLHCCESSDVQQGAAAALLQALQYRLDFSCSSAMDLTEETQEPPLHLRPEDCRVISMVIQRVSVNPELMLMDCDVEEAGLEHLFSVLERIRLRCSKGQLLQLLALVCVGSERECVRRAVSLSHAVRGEVDLSHTVLDARACGSLALFLEYSEGLSELDLSHCQLTDQCLEPLLPHLHKIQSLDLSNNSITDEGAQLIHNTVNAATSIQTVRLFNNNIQNRRLFQGDARFELW
ncbi:uncharacterized protein LOC134079124 [Sardina pilchardus]|uniref:uncharacterized protein LOC134079124 n=1 Tax=Sardina pilchardus TaxID=27697 RepID=UPI002E142065